MIVKSVLKLYSTQIPSNLQVVRTTSIGWTTSFFSPTCTQGYRKKAEVVRVVPFKDRFQVKDGMYLLPHPPLKPLTAYNVFTLLYMKIIRENYPNETTSVVLKKLSSLWNDDEFMIEHKLEVLNLSKFQYDLFYKEQQFYRTNYTCPIEPIGPYQIYLKENYKRVQEEIEENDLARITASITRDWKALSQEKRAEYSAIFQDRFRAYKQKLEAFNDTFQIPILKPKNIYNVYIAHNVANNKRIKEAAETFSADGLLSIVGEELISETLNKKQVKNNNSKQAKKGASKIEKMNELQEQAQIMLKQFNELSPEEKAKYERIKETMETQTKQKIDKFKLYFDLSDEDYVDICQEVKLQLADKAQSSRQKESYKQISSSIDEDEIEKHHYVD